MRYALYIVFLTVFLALTGCGGGGKGDLVIEDADLGNIPNLSRIKNALPGDEANTSYTDEILKPDVAP